MPHLAAPGQFLTLLAIKIFLKRHSAIAELSLLTQSLIALLLRFLLILCMQLLLGVFRTFYLTDSCLLFISTHSSFERLSLRFNRQFTLRHFLQFFIHFWYFTRFFTHIFFCCIFICFFPFRLKSVLRHHTAFIFIFLVYFISFFIGAFRHFSFFCFR